MMHIDRKVLLDKSARAQTTEMTLKLNQLRKKATTIWELGLCERIFLNLRLISAVTPGTAPKMASVSGSIHGRVRVRTRFRDFGH